MQTVFDNRQCAHVWAQGTQYNGRGSKGSLFFEGARLYSYGTHFVVGLLLPNGDALMNSESYSVSTSKHQSFARQAVRGRCVYLPALTTIAGPYAPLADLANAYRHGKPSADQFKRARAAVLTYLAEYAKAIDLESVAYLLRFVGVTAADVKAAGIVAKSQRAAERAKKAEQAKEHAEYLKRAAEVFALRTPQARAAFLLEKGGDDPESVYYLKRFAPSLHKMHRAAKKAGRDKVAAAVWQMSKAFRDEIARRENLDKRFGANVPTWKRGAKWTTLRAIGRFRARAAEYAAGAISERGLRDWEQAAWTLAKDSNVPAKVKATLESTHAAILRAKDEAARERVKDWRAGRVSSINETDANGGAYLRAVAVERNAAGDIVGGTLQTSLGASAPLAHAVKAFRFIKRCRERATGWEANGHTIRVGNFRVDSITAAGDIKAGCHVIHWGETSRLADELGLTWLKGDESALEASGHAHA